MFSVIFPGQGSQSVGMAKDIYNKFDIAKELFKEADSVLNFSITKLILDGTKEELDQTENTQPAIFLVGYSIFQLIKKEFAIDLNKANYFAGHSLGGMICPAYSRKFPDRVVSLGLLSTAAGRTEEDSLKVLNVIKAMEENGIEKTLNTLTNRWFTDEFLTKHSDLVKRRLDQVMKTDANIFLNVFRIYAKTEMAPWLSEVIAPSLVLTGEQDGGCNPRLNKFIADNLKNSKLVILPKYKHSLLIEAPDEVAKNLIQFMSKFKIK